jgi:hypothetical protein
MDFLTGKLLQSNQVFAYKNKPKLNLLNYFNRLRVTLVEQPRGDSFSNLPLRLTSWAL